LLGLAPSFPFFFLLLWEGIIAASFSNSFKLYASSSSKSPSTMILLMVANSSKATSFYFLFLILYFFFALSSTIGVVFRAGCFEVICL
jgi:hypothetical protein